MKKFFLGDPLARLAKLSTAKPADHKIKWYQVVFILAIIGMGIWSRCNRPNNEYLLPLAAFPLLITLGCLWWNWRNNGHIFDDRA